MAILWILFEALYSNHLQYSYYLGTRKFVKSDVNAIHKLKVNPGRVLKCEIINLY